MNPKRVLFIMVILLAIIPACVRDKASIQFEQSFLNPPDSARAHTWWHWLDGNVSKEGITKDLEAMKEAGLAGFQLFDVGLRYPPGPVEFNSDVFHDHIAHTIAEADRLGLEMGINSASGWSSTGGPWIKPENSMKMLIWSETEVGGGSSRAITLEQPIFSKDQEQYGFYHDVAVLAFPTPKDPDFRIERWEEKSMTKIRTRSDGFLPAFSEAPADALVKLDEIQVLSDCMDAEGKLDWTVPAGDWTILRIGFSTTGAQIRPGSKGGMGLEVDKLSRQAVAFHWEQLLDKIIADADGKKAFTTILIDSYEVGCQNWTEGFDRLFMDRCGYDLIPRLVCMTGRVVESPDYTERLLWDLRATVADIMHQNYFEFFAEKCHDEGLLLACETYGTGSFDALRTAELVDLPMSEFWHRDEPWPRRNLWEWTSQIVPSGAHLTGRSIVGAEAFTRMKGDWTVHPYIMKVWGDRAFTQGVNRYYFHTSAHQPWNDKVKPGMTMGQFGFNLHRNNTWFSQAREWFDYIARCQFILQQGTYIADLLVLYGDERGFNSLLANNEPIDMEWIPGFRFDLGRIETLEALSVDPNGYIRVSHEGKLLDNKYKMILLKRASLLRPEMVQKLGKLAEDGALIFAPRPIRTPSLVGFPGSEVELQEGLEKYWGTGIIKAPEMFEDTMGAMQMDCEIAGPAEYAHHRIHNDDFYFLSNQSYEATEMVCRFRVSGKQPELWDPESGMISQANNWKKLDDGRTEVTLDMSPAGSVFVVFRKSTMETGHTTPLPGHKELFQINNDWQVSFDPEWGAKEPVAFAELIPWNEHPEDNVKYYSGTAIYRSDFEISGSVSKLFIDLGNVEVMARVWVNGEDLGLAWKPPYRKDISRAVKNGINNLEIEVTNLWPNRLIGDAAYPVSGRLVGPPKSPGKYFDEYPEWLIAGEPPPESGRTFDAYRHWDKDSELLPSGLLGPVRILEFVNTEN